MTAVADENYRILATNEYEILLDKGALIDDVNSTLDQALLVKNGIQI